MFFCYFKNILHISFYYHKICPIFNTVVIQNVTLTQSATGNHCIVMDKLRMIYVPLAVHCVPMTLSVVLTADHDSGLMFLVDSCTGQSERPHSLAALPAPDGALHTLRTHSHAALHTEDHRSLPSPPTGGSTGQTQGRVFTSPTLHRGQCWADTR